MGFLDDIKNKIFGAPAPAAAPASVATPAPSPAAAAQKQAALDAGMEAANKVIAEALAKKQAEAQVDVAAILDAAVAASGQKLNWKTSIVDLMKALNLDSSLTARKALADELGYEGDKSDSATMNIWLHKQVLRRLAENGGKVPETLLA
ncbi:DUF3597 domain-containing protein [Devosia faecipullorum]|uniref:DUF3597 domain-containing protein n=1 Tax=Devosia faecipullorum TaxID=2755039 RepID=UPI00187B6DDF|nr:DUF3597 domain-containing protein [Devosia faecipullorum]MBE7732391.1 DUF3597 domain-containing protein [Devosia faecipullorum]